MLSAMALDILVSLNALLLHIVGSFLQHVTTCLLNLEGEFLIMYWPVQHP